MKAKKKNQLSPQEKAIREGIAIISSSTLLGSFWEHANLEVKLCPFDQGTAAIVSYGRDKYPHYSWQNSSRWFGRIFLNKHLLLPPQEWAYAIAHAVMHLAFGHFDAENMPGYEEIGADGTKSGMFPAISTSLNFWKTLSSAAPCGMYRWLPTRARLRMSAAYTVISSKMAIRRESTALARPHTILWILKVLENLLYTVRPRALRGIPRSIPMPLPLPVI